MHTSVQLLSRGRRSVTLWFSLVFITLSASQNTLAITTSAPLSDKSRAILKDAQQEILDKKYQRALELSADVLDENPKQYQAQFIRAEALSHLGKTDEAIKLYKDILNSNPQQPEVYNNLANLYARQGNLELARQTLEQGIATNEQYKTLYENLSAIYVEMARGAYSKALKLGVQAKAVQLRTLNVASLSQVPRTQIASSNLTGHPTPNPVGKNTVTKVNTSAVSSSKENSTQIAMVEQKLQLPVKAPAKTETKEVKAIKTVQSSIRKTNHNPPVKKAAPTINKDEVITALHGWAAAWSAQAVDLYLSFYGDEFKPAKLSKNVWAVQRRIRIKKPRWVNVQLADFDVKMKAAHKDRAVVQLVQDYRADNYHDKTKKQFEMKRTIDGWRILSEQSLAVIR